MLLTTGSNTAIAGSGLRLHGALQEARALHACGGGGSVQVLSQYSLGNGASWWNLAGWEQEPAGPGGTRGQCAAGHGPGCLGFLEAFSLTQRAAFLHQLPGRPPSPLRSLPWWLPWPGPVLSALHVPSHPTLGQWCPAGEKPEGTKLRLEPKTAQCQILVFFHSSHPLSQPVFPPPSRPLPRSLSCLRGPGARPSSLHISAAVTSSYFSACEPVPPAPVLFTTGQAELIKQFPLSQLQAKVQTPAPWLAGWGPLLVCL